MECREARGLATAAIDKELAGRKPDEFLEHIGRCLGCRDEYELELMTKNVVRKNLTYIPASRDLKRLIASQIASQALEEESVRDAQQKRRRRFWRTLFGFGAGAGIALLLFILLLSGTFRHWHSQPVDADIIHQTYNNYDGFIRGTMTPAIASDDPILVRSFFTPVLRFPVAMPVAQPCRLVGGAWSTYADEPIAHVLYRHRNTLVYVYETRLGSLGEGGALQLSSRARLEIQRSGRYIENLMPGCTLVAWIADSTVCCAVGDLSRDEFLSYLKERE